jgi:hypothetical protein
MAVQGKKYFVRRLMLGSGSVEILPVAVPMFIAFQWEIHYRGIIKGEREWDFVNSVEFQRVRQDLAMVNASKVQTDSAKRIRCP